MKYLRPHQIKSADSLVEILRNHTSAIDASDTGTGKTYVACAVAAQLKLPTLAVVPKIAISSWKRACESLGEEISITNYEKLRTGNTPYGRWSTVKPAQEFFVCQCCQQKVEFDKLRPCYTNVLGIHCIETKRKPAKYGNFVFDPAVKFLIFDESQRCNGMKSLNAEMLIAAVRQNIKHLMLSATPADTILKMRALGYSLGLHGDKNTTFTSTGIKPPFHSWLRPLGVKPHPAFRGLLWMESETKQRSIMARINRQIIPSRGVRVTTDEIPDFPKRNITAELYDLENPQELERIYQEMDSALRALSERATEDKSEDHPLTKILRARQKIELLKIPIFIELVKDALEKGFSTGVFVCFKQTVDEISKRLNAPIIDGSVTGDARQQLIDSFQRNEIRCLVLNNAAGGLAISLQDLQGEYPRVGFVSPSFSASEFKQILGRFHREGGKSTCHYRVILVARTIETRIKTKLDSKLDNLNFLVDGDLSIESLESTV